ncbi:hypothetical protein O3M35_004969 [Rhynocoris fuscipes]|uniref:Uncharacterized protein n=1 Tax=Rhynocoris fuscipes TaxID=488301 RepID=A0AAW1DHC8_9HEMI
MPKKQEEIESVQKKHSKSKMRKQSKSKQSSSTSLMESIPKIKKGKKSERKETDKNKLSPKQSKMLIKSFSLNDVVSLIRNSISTCKQSISKAFNLDDPSKEDKVEIFVNKQPSKLDHLETIPSEQSDKKDVKEDKSLEIINFKSKLVEGTNLSKVTVSVKGKFANEKLDMIVNPIAEDILSDLLCTLKDIQRR